MLFHLQQASTLLVFRNAHEMELTCADIMLLCDLFYLPFEHDSKALQLLAEFHWLKIKAQVLFKNRSRKPSLATTRTAGDSKCAASGQFANWSTRFDTSQCRLLCLCSDDNGLTGGKQKIQQHLTELFATVIVDVVGASPTPS
ncbi:uncharacterized protein LOC120424223 [Culex pipiens pallens]|uniref:uncharacterized protein LOC120424223 n=1 Tax=Culex pipiens pallens TaxID=42434 RepID=UPI00195380DB|nr:uncharacterized protein LOC120424223 [Culex pipiens pallens]